MNTKPTPVIVTDLDGTLLDHNSYSFAAAEEALNLIAERGYPLILNSSKTSVEILILQEQLGFRQPFICENGAAVFLPTGDSWHRHAFAEPRSDWLPWIHQLREQHQLQFEGFSDWSAEKLAEITGLTEDNAKLAADRDYSEPLQWHGTKEELQNFKQTIAERDLRLVRGGRFYSLQGQFDKAQAMQWLKAHYQQQGPVITIALGDSPNDCAMLNAADIAVVIQSANSALMNVEGPKKIIRTTLPGPSGWQQAMTTIIGELDNQFAIERGTNHG